MIGSPAPVGPTQNSSPASSYRVGGNLSIVCYGAVTAPQEFSAFFSFDRRLGGLLGGGAGRRRRLLRRRLGGFGGGLGFGGRRLGGLRRRCLGGRLRLW